MVMYNNCHNQQRSQPDDLVPLYANIPVLIDCENNNF